MVLLRACSSQKMARTGSGNYDDVYYSSNDAVNERNPTSSPEQNTTTQPADYYRFTVGRIQGLITIKKTQPQQLPQPIRTAIRKLLIIIITMMMIIMIMPIHHV